MAKFVYDKPTAADIAFLAAHMRIEDRRELIGAVGPDVQREVERCVRNSAKCWVCRYDGVVLAAFGVIETNPLQKHGILWMLSTRYTVNHKVYAGKWTKKGLAAFLSDFEYLYNYIDAGNKATIAWLKWLGAEIHPAEPYGIYGLPYHLFTFRRNGHGRSGNDHRNIGGGMAARTGGAGTGECSSATGRDERGHSRE